MKKIKDYFKICFLLIVVFFDNTQISFAISKQEDIFDKVGRITENKKIKNPGKYSIQQNTHSDLIINNTEIHCMNNPIHTRTGETNPLAVLKNNYGEKMLMKKEQFEIFERQSKAKVMKWLLMISLALRGR